MLIKKPIIFVLITIILIVSTLQLTSAIVDWIIPSEAELNSNFDVKIFGDKLYFPEITVPNGFEIVLDKSNGIITNNIYRTYYTSNLDITFRPTSIGTFTFKGVYSQGDGVKSFSDKTITIKTSGIEITCPVCPINEEWSECILEKQKRNTYSCSELTDFICESTEEERECQQDVSIKDKLEDKTKNRFITKITDFFKYIWDKLIFWR